MKGLSGIHAILGLAGLTIAYFNLDKIMEFLNNPQIQTLYDALIQPITLPMFILIIGTILIAKWF